MPLPHKAQSESYTADYKILLKLGLPVMITQLGIVVVSFADTMMVAAYDTKALAASAFVNSIFLVAIVMQLGFASGLTPLAGALFSRSDFRGAGRYMRAGLIANTLLSIIFTLLLGVLYLFLDKLGQPEELLPLIRPYYLTLLASLLPMAIFNTFQQVSNGCTDTATPMWLIIGGNIMNIVGNYMLIFGKWGAPCMGLTGAGISTLASRIAIMAAITAIYLFSRSRRKYREGAKEKHEGRTVIRHVWSTSWPVMIQSGIECFLWTFGAIVCGWYGTIQLASYQVVNIISQLGFMIFMGFGVATSIRVANLTGLGDIAGVTRTTKAGLHIMLLLATAASLTFALLFRPLVQLFTPDSEVVAACMPLMIPLILYQYGDATQLTYANAIRGTSRVRPLFYCSTFAYLLFGVPLVYLLAVVFDWHNVGVYYSFSGVLFLAALLLYISFGRTVRQM